MTGAGRGGEGEAGEAGAEAEEEEKGDGEVAETKASYKNWISGKNKLVK